MRSNVQLRFPIILELYIIILSGYIIIAISHRLSWILVEYVELTDECSVCYSADGLETLITNYDLSPPSPTTRPDLGPEKRGGNSVSGN